MAYYGESTSYYGGGEQRPPYERPPYERPPYERPPYDEHRGPSYDSRPPYEGQRSYDSRPPYEENRGSPYDSRPPYSSAPPSARPPQYPPPPLPIGWIQEWEPSARRAFFVETATGRAEWILPADVTYGGGEQSRSAGDYYAPAPVPVPPPGYPPQDYNQGYAQGYNAGEYHEEKKEKKEKSSDTGKLLAAGAVGLALGAVGGGILGHELAESSSSDEEAHYSGGDDD